MRVVTLLLLLLVGTAKAESVARVAKDGTAIRLISTTATTQLRVGKAKPVEVARKLAFGALVAGHDRTIAAVATTAKEPFRVYAIAGAKVGEVLKIERPNQRRDAPYAVVGTPTATGFAIFFQEIELDDPTAAHTYMVELDKEGALRGAAKEVAIPWGLAAVIATPNGFHFALIYPGDGMHLSMVSTDASAKPQQHPDWATPAGIVSQVHLVAKDQTIRAIYRSGNRILEVDVTTIGQWGATTNKPKALGTIGTAQLLAVDATGTIAKVAR